MVAKVTIDHVVHGYDRGHRLLFSTTSLNPDAQRAMLELSDPATSSPLLSDETALSGYPLKKERKYVFARTWGAGDSFRPGSVWTHSVVFDYALLTVLEDLTQLVWLHKNPRLVPQDWYEPLTLDEVQPFDRSYLSGVTYRDDTAQILRQLYGLSSKREISVPTFNPEQDEKTLLALWRQMWPGLRRDFAFFTRSSDAHNEVGAGCTITFGTHRSAAFDVQELESQASIPAIKMLIDDLGEAGPTPLRQFLARYTSGTLSARREALSIVDLYLARRDPLKLLDIYDAKRVSLEKSGVLQKDLIKFAADHASSFDIAIQGLNLFSESESEKGERLISAISHADFNRRQQADIITKVSTSPIGTIGNSVFEELVKSADISTLQEILTDDIASRILSLQPSIAYREEFWNSSRQRSELIKASLALEVDASRLIQALGSTLTTEECRLLLAQNPSFVEPIYHSSYTSPCRYDILVEVARRADILRLIGRNIHEWALSEIETASKILLTEGLSVPESQSILDSLRRTKDQRLTTPYLYWVTFIGAVTNANYGAAFSMLQEVYDLVCADRTPPDSVQRWVYGRSETRTEYSWISKLNALMIMPFIYKGIPTSGAVCVSRDKYRVEQVVKFVRFGWGEDGLRAIYLGLESEQTRPLIGRSTIVEMLENAMPLFSAPLDSGSRARGKKNKK
jgi:hypothetical protein